MQLLPYEQCREIERTHVCAVCKGLLVTVWVGMENHYGIACAQDHTHQGFQREMFYAQRYRAGMPIPLEVAIQFQRRKMNEIKHAEWDDRDSHIELTPEEAAEMKSEKETGKSSIMALLPREDIGNKTALTRDQVTMLLEIAHALKLDPYLQHIVIYFGRPYITEAGMLYHAHHSEELDGIVSRPLTLGEKKDAMFPDDEHVWKAWVYRRGYKHPFVSLGRAREDEKRPIAKGSFVEPLHPQRTAEKRAEMQALKKAFPIGLPILGEEPENEEEQQ